MKLVFQWVTPPPSVYLSRHDIIFVMKWTRPLLCFILHTVSDQKRGIVCGVVNWF